jgi:hypothetical protein
MWYNSKTNECQSEPPWSGYLDPSKVSELYADWEQKDDTFVPPSIPLSIDDQAAAIIAKYKPKLDTYKDLILSTIATDGANQAEKTASFQAKYNAEVAKQNLELEALYDD